MNDEVAKKIEDFFSNYKLQKYRKGEILIRANDVPAHVFYLKKGRVKKYAISRKGDELIVNMFKPISFFPMSHAMADIPNAYYYEAMEDSEVIKAPGNEVVFFLRREPDVLFDLLTRVYRGTEGLLTRMTYLMAGNAYARVISEILITSKRFGKINNGEIELVLSEKDLANQAGMTRETVSREIKTLKDKGLVKFSKKHLIIKDIGLLEEEISEGA